MKDENQAAGARSHTSSHSSFILRPSSLSIVVPSHSRPDLLELCLASVNRFAPAGTEVVVVDDG